RGHANGRGRGRQRPRHRPRARARLRPPHGPVEDERPRRPRRAPGDRGDAGGRVAVGAIRASGDPEDPRRGGQDRQESRRGLLPVGGRPGGRRERTRGGAREEAVSDSHGRPILGGRRGGLGLGVALVGLGVYILLERSFHVHGPGPILLLIGAALFAVAAMRRFQGPLVPAGVLLGLGAAFLVRDPLEPWVPGWATILFGIGGGL